VKELLTYIIKSILGEEEVEVKEESLDSRTLILTIKVPETEYGKIIGKKGRIINAVRKIINLAANKEGKRAIVKLATENQSPKGLDLGPADTDPSPADNSIEI